MKPFQLILCGLLLFVSCQNRQEKPSLVIPKDKMIDILVDFQLAEASLYLKNQKHPVVLPYTNHYYDSLLKKHQITMKQFNESLNYYKNNTDELEKMFDEAQDRLSQLRSETR